MMDIVPYVFGLAGFFAGLVGGLWRNRSRIVAIESDLADLMNDVSALLLQMKTEEK